ncbi:hypothetical protein JZU54_03970, partial [bacterium]|nr:hypothetical protein [bacterium]
ALIGMPQAIIYSAARFKKRAATFAATGAVVALVATLMSAACGAMVLPHLLDGHSDQVVFAAQVFLLIGPIYAVIMVIEPMRSVGRTATWNALRIIPAGL